jgi:dipeptide/tripeptide permease
MNNLILLIFALQALILAMVCIALLSSLHRRGVQSPSPRRFSLRALLASMTLLALSFGFAANAFRK